MQLLRQIDNNDRCFTCVVGCPPLYLSIFSSIFSLMFESTTWWKLLENSFLRSRVFFIVGAYSVLTLHRSNWVWLVRAWRDISGFASIWSTHTELHRNDTVQTRKSISIILGIFQIFIYDVRGSAFLILNNERD